MTIITASAFAEGDAGGNPCTLAKGRWSDKEMLELARRKGHECCLVTLERASSYRLRFFAPSSEMDMCAHASLAAAWLVCAPGGGAVRFTSKGGTFRAMKSPTGEISIGQPPARINEVDSNAALVALSIGRHELAAGQRIVNAASTRSKTLVPLASPVQLHLLDPDSEDVRACCDSLGSTGLYPWAEIRPGEIEARQFPRSAGYREDPATGVAAAALFFALGQPKNGLTVHQGRVMGRLSRIDVRSDPENGGCLLSGHVRPVNSDEPVSMSGN